jgi:hypothetical protein
MTSFFGASFFLVAFGVAGVSSAGFISRYNSEDAKVLSDSINASDYMLTHFNSLRLANFDETADKSKIVLIGDSFAQDLANAVNESTLKRSLQISTHHISARCGNLYLGDIFIHNILEEHRNFCESRGWYENTRLKKLLVDADQVWLASDWVEWTAELLPESVKDIEQDFNVEVVVFGTKEFQNNFNLKNFLKLNGVERRNHASELSARVVGVNKTLRDGLKGNKFVDIAALICPDETCFTLTPDGGLWTYDGAHLTQSGARSLGLLLQKEIEKNE